MLIGVPMILFGLIFLYTGYVRYDAEQYLDELEGEQTTQSENRGQAENADADHEVEQKRSDRSPRADPADETEQRDR
ncbi:hypothetical protein C482_01751 [Natrialba chahannaoensis JCM 10990]|uniref:Uncharacterized protein n=2 Tax=Natrialba chahannaoensis TaxID=68911 RepID=M0B3W9_9EURY|nr:hypothetical protein C482_01751 [Natrialba chahannaoensis JCM 10990]